MTYHNNCLESLTLIQRTDEEEFLYNSVTFGEIMQSATGEWMRWVQNSWGMIFLTMSFSLISGATQLNAGDHTHRSKGINLDRPSNSNRPPQVSRIKPRQAPPVKMVDVSDTSEECQHCKPKQAPPVKRSKTKTGTINPPCSALCVCGCNDGEECTCNKSVSKLSNTVITGQVMNLSGTQAHTLTHAHTHAYAPAQAPVDLQGVYPSYQYQPPVQPWGGYPQYNQQTMYQPEPQINAQPQPQARFETRESVFLPGGSSDDCPSGTK